MKKNASIKDEIRKLSEYKKWRNKVYKRDEKTCQCCGAVNNGKLTTHHIKPFWKIIEDNKVTTVSKAQNCPELWDTKNGQTLCKSCHRVANGEA